MQAMQTRRQALGAVNGNQMAPVQQQGPVKEQASGIAKYTGNGYQMKKQPEQQVLMPKGFLAVPQQMPKVLPQKAHSMQAPNMPKKQLHATKQWPNPNNNKRQRTAPAEEKMVIMEFVRPAPQETVHAEVARGMPIHRKSMGTMMQVRPMGGSASSQYEYETRSSTKSDVSMGKTISIKETTFIKGPMKAEKSSFELEEVSAKLQIQAPTPLGAKRRAPAPPVEDIQQANMVEQWLANQQPPPAPMPLPDDARSTRSASSSNVDIKSVYDFEVTNTGSTRSRTYNEMPAPGSFMHGAPGEGPGLVC